MLKINELIQLFNMSEGKINGNIRKESEDLANIEGEM